MILFDWVCNNSTASNASWATKSFKDGQLILLFATLDVAMAMCSCAHFFKDPTQMSKLPEQSPLDLWLPETMRKWVVLDKLSFFFHFYHMLPIDHQKFKRQKRDDLTSFSYYWLENMKTTRCYYWLVSKKNPTLLH